jgi:hypothetical protein
MSVEQFADSVCRLFHACFEATGLSLKTFVRGFASMSTSLFLSIYVSPKEKKGKKRKKEKERKPLTATERHSRF